MNQYPIWIGIAVAFVMVCATSNPAWWMLVALGIGANGLVTAANGWKMPVRGRIEESIRHTPMITTTRHSWLGDVIPTGLGKASVGDFLLAAGMLGAYATRSQLSYASTIALFGLAWWASGWVKGFCLFEKWTAEARRDCRKNIPIVLVLMLIGSALHIRGCSVGELQGSTKAIESAIGSRGTSQAKNKAALQSKWRDLGPLAAPPWETLTRLKRETAKQEQKLVREAAVEAVAGVTFTVKQTPKSARIGPFCRVTCAAHHGGEYDVETVPELCRANWIPPGAFYVPGWYSEASDNLEYTNPWPGPAQQGFGSYRLYWSTLQSTARVLHATESVSR
jgi:hypothetical protein